jgi:hypothetical protein
MCGGDQAPHINAGCFAKVHAFWVDQNNLAWRRDAAQNVAGLAVHHAVQRGGLGVGLLKVDIGVFANVEAGPVNHSPLAGLVDVEGAA